MPRAIGFGLVCAGFAIVVAGCQMMPDPQFASLDRALRLRIVDVRPSERAGSADFRLELDNSGTTTAHACLGPGRNVDYRFGSSGGGTIAGVDHPGCVREFSIPPGGSMAWTETLRVSLSQGPGEVSARVQIVNPRRCSAVGCTAFDLRSQEFQVP